MEEIQGAGLIFYIKGAVPEDEGPGVDGRNSGSWPHFLHKRGRH